jgi:hypothetical protein
LETGGSEPQRVHARGNPDQPDHCGPRKRVSREAQSQRDGHTDDPQTDPIREAIHARRGRQADEESQPRLAIDLGAESLSRFSTTEHTEHTETNPPPVMSSFRVFGLFRGSLLFGDKSEYVVAAPQYRAAANTAMGWKNSNLRTEMTRLLRRAGVSILATIVPLDAGHPANRTATRVSVARGPLLAW